MLKGEGGAQVSQVGACLCARFAGPCPFASDYSLLWPFLLMCGMLLQYVRLGEQGFLAACWYVMGPTGLWGLVSAIVPSIMRAQSKHLGLQLVIP